MVWLLAKDSKVVLIIFLVVAVVIVCMAYAGHNFQGKLLNELWNCILSMRNLDTILSEVVSECF